MEDNIIKSTKQPIIKQYFDLYDKYIQEYPNCILLIQIGKFYEMYSCENRGPNLDLISKQLDVLKTRRNKNISTVSIDNPNQIGFPCIAYDKFITELLKHYNYIVVISQNKNDTGKVDRNKIDILTKGTYIENITVNTNYILCVYLTTNKQKNNKILYASGITLIDVSTNKLYISENYSTILDEYYTINEINRFITMNNPKEVIIYLEENIDIKTIKNEIKFNNIECKIIKPEYKKLNYQIETLKKIYNKYVSNLSIIETLNLERNPMIITALIGLFNYINNTNKKLLDNILLPELYSDTNNLILGNNAVLQLNLFDSRDDNGTKYKCLFDIINKTLTPMGERYLKHKLLTPIINTDELNKIYNGTEYIIKQKIQLDELINIADIEKIFRKMELSICKPQELFNLYKSFETIKQIKTKHLILETEFNIKINESKIDELLKYINYLFNINNLAKYILGTNIFNSGVYPELDKLVNTGENIASIYNQLKEHMISEYMKKYNKKIIIKVINKDGFYFTCSNKLATELKELMINRVYDINGMIINMTNMEIKPAKTSKISITGIRNMQNEDIKEKLILELFNKEIIHIYNQYADMIRESIKYITLLDFLYCNSKLKTQYNYNKPCIIQQPHGWIKAEQLRHPIIEKLTDTPYIPHNIEIGKDIKGMLIYGINSAGKSSLMKKLGLSLILAQTGLYVPASKFEFTPYKSIYTRISAHDDIFKGHSSFAVEMIELNNIIENADEFSLIIGDEICRSTESVSANAIVAQTILSLNDKNASFMLATHLHELMNIQKIKDLKYVKPYHIKVNYVNDKLEYNRQLSEGSGDNIYGLTVASFIIRDKTFINGALEIKNELLKQTDIVNNKTSRYNNKLFITDCAICGTNESLETHHIHYQQNCTNGFINELEHIDKNNISNLIVICSKCHDFIHSNKIKLMDYVLTSDGKKIITKKMTTKK